MDFPSWRRYRQGDSTSRAIACRRAWYAQNHRVKSYRLGKLGDGGMDRSFAWQKGQIKSGDTVAEASSGSTSIAFALACSQMGLHFVAFIPDSATSERELIIKAYGGEVRRIKGGMPEVLRVARETSEDRGWFLGRQFANGDNTEAHRLNTGPEILEQIPGGTVDAVVSGVGTGGTLRGLYEAFSSAGCPVTAHAAIPREGALFGSNIEC